MKGILFITFSVCSFISYTQDAIITDRPTQSASAFVVSEGSLLLETGFSSEKVTSGITNLTFFNALLRWGLLDGMELRLTQNYVGSNILSNKKSGLSPLSLGTKIHLMAEDGAKPQMSVIGQVTLRTGNDRFRPSSSVTELRFNFQNTLSENVSLGYNVGTIFIKDNTQIIYSAVLGMSIVDGWSVFAEPYGFFGNDSDQRFNAGVIYLYQSNLQFDISFGAGISKLSPDSFIGFGASFGLN